MERKLTVGDIFAESSRLFGENAGLALGSITGLTVLNVLIDLGRVGSEASTRDERGRGSTINETGPLSRSSPIPTSI